MTQYKVFVSYRRDDSADEAVQIFERLHQKFPGRVFMDGPSLKPGQLWRREIDSVLSASQACIVVIGPRWAGQDDATHRRRIDEPGDNVRMEVATALKRSLFVLPVLVRGATLPLEHELPPVLRPLRQRQCLTVNRGSHADLDLLCRSIEEEFGWLAKPAPVQATARTRVIWATAALIAMLGGSFLWHGVPGTVTGATPQTESPGVALPASAASSAKRPDQVPPETTRDVPEESPESGAPANVDGDNSLERAGGADRVSADSRQSTAATEAVGGGAASSSDAPVANSGGSPPKRAVVPKPPAAVKPLPPAEWVAAPSERQRRCAEITRRQTKGALLSRADSQWLADSCGSAR